MKKFMMAILVVAMFSTLTLMPTGCNLINENKNTTDSTVLDSVEMIDSTVLDSVEVIDSIEVVK